MVERLVTISVDKVREDFPVLRRRINGKPLVYFDNAATSQKPIQVIRAIEEYYRWYNANIHRGIHRLAEEATLAYEEAREKIAKFINASSRDEIIFTRGTTEAINLVAYAWGRTNISKGDLIVSTEMEHHSNIVPWQLLAREKQATLEFVHVDDQGFLKEEELDRILTLNPKLLAVTHVSNVLGTINPVKEIIRKAHAKGCLVLLDGAQSVPHMPVDVQELDCDFMAFSGHKMMGPTGIGVLYAKKEILGAMEPFHGGGEMIREVHLDGSTWKDIPYKFEAGTPNIVGTIGLGAAVDYLNELGMGNVHEHETELVRYALSALSKVKDLRIYGPRDPTARGGIVPFNCGDIHPHDLATILDEDGIAIRSGHHCAMPLHERYDLSATARASFYIYNTKDEVDVLVASLEKARKLFRL